MSLVKRAYNRRDDDEESSDVEKPTVSTPVVAETMEKTNGKKRLGSSAAESAAKLLKLADSTSNDTRHAIDIANQMLHRNQEAQATRQEIFVSTGPRSLLDLLPSPKAQSSSKKTSSTLNSDGIASKESVDVSNETASTSPDVTASSSRLHPAKAMKKKNLSPDVNFDETMLRVTMKEGNTESFAQSAPVRIVGPVVPSFLKGMKNSENDRVSEAAAYMQPNRSAGEVETFGVHRSSLSTGASGYGTAHLETFAAQHYDPSFGVPGSDNVVDINVRDLVSAPSAPVPLPTHTRSAASGISRTARSKNQITYLAAVAPETERKMQEKKAELAKTNKFGRY